MSKELTNRMLASEKISEARKSKGLTQPQAAELLAKALGGSYSARQYGKLENGIFPKFKGEVVAALEKIFAIKISHLIYEQNVPHGTLDEKYQAALESQVDLHKQLHDAQKEIQRLKDELKEIEELRIIVKQWKAANSGADSGYPAKTELDEARRIYEGMDKGTEPPEVKRGDGHQRKRDKKNAKRK